MVILFTSQFNYDFFQEKKQHKNAHSVTEYTQAINENFNPLEYLFNNDTQAIIIDSLLFDKLETLINFIYHLKENHPSVKIILINYFTHVNYEIVNLGITIVEYDQFKAIENFDQLLLYNTNTEELQITTRIHQDFYKIGVIQTNNNTFASTTMQLLGEKIEDKVARESKYIKVLAKPRYLKKEEMEEMCYFNEKLTVDNYLKFLKNGEEKKINFYELNKFDDYEIDLLRSLLYQFNIVIIFLDFLLTEEDVEEFFQANKIKIEHKVYLKQEKLYKKSQSDLLNQIYFKKKIKEIISIIDEEQE